MDQNSMYPLQSVFTLADALNDRFYLMAVTGKRV